MIFAGNSVIKSDFSVYEKSPSVTGKPGATLQPCCAHITRSSISGTQMQNGRQMLFVLFSVYSVSGQAVCSPQWLWLRSVYTGDGALKLLALTRIMFSFIIQQ